MEPKTHWERVYSTKVATELSWYQPEPTRSLELLLEAGIDARTQIIDVGGGDSTLVDVLTERQLGRVTVLDISAAALNNARARLGERATGVTWMEADITSADLGTSTYDVWHDRAVFHFLTAPTDRDRYVAQATKAIRPGGSLILATFALDGPLKCSGLDVARYGVPELASVFAGGFVLDRGFDDVHRTPAGKEQQFIYAVLRRR